MKIRDYTNEDYEKVINLLVDCDVEPPKDKDELNGPCMVAEKDDNIVGIIFALTGKSCKAYIDYFAVNKSFRKTTTPYKLFTSMDDTLRGIGIKRYLFHVEKYNLPFIENLYKRREKLKIKMLNDLYYFSREIT